MKDAEAKARRFQRIGDLLELGVGKRARLLAELTPDECAQLFHDWSLWARPDSSRRRATGSSG